MWNLPLWNFTSVFEPRHENCLFEHVQTILNYFMAYRVYLSDYLPLDIGTTAAYLSIGANQFALKILKLFI